MNGYIEARFHTRQNKFLLDVDLRIPDRGITALFGPSGAGKTTLLRAIAGLEQHPGGFLKIGEMIWQDAGQFVPTHQRQLGYVFQEASLFAHLNVRRNLEYGVRRLAEAEFKSRTLINTIDLLGIGDLLDRKPHTLSGGERQRVAIARALAINPRILLMDEPLSFLDQALKQEIFPYLETLHAELDIPVIYVSHLPDEVARLADHLVLLEGGQVTASGPIAEMLTRLDLSLTQGEDAEAVIEARVVAHDEAYHLTYLDFAGNRFTVARNQLAVGSLIRLRLAARDVSLTLERHPDTSILNIFPATIDKIMPQGSAQVMVRLLVGEVPFLARVTRKSSESLGLRPGIQVYAQAKSAAVLI